MRSFNDSIEQLLWPEKRDKDSVLGAKIPGVIDRTTVRSYLRVAGGYLPDFLRPLLGPLHRFAPWLFGEGGVEIGPIPAGTPVSLLGSLELLPDGGNHAEQIRLLPGKEGASATPTSRRRRKSRTKAAPPATNPAVPWKSVKMDHRKMLKK